MKLSLNFWRKVADALFRDRDQPFQILRTCLICDEPLREENQGRLFRCANGHEFGKDGKRVDLINAGDHHGEGDQGI